MIQPARTSALCTLLACLLLSPACSTTVDQHPHTLAVAPPVQPERDTTQTHPWKLVCEPVPAALDIGAITDMVIDDREIIAGAGAPSLIVVGTRGFCTLTPSESWQPKKTVEFVDVDPSGRSAMRLLSSRKSLRLHFAECPTFGHGGPIVHSEDARKEWVAKKGSSPSFIWVRREEPPQAALIFDLMNSNKVWLVDADGKTTEQQWEGKINDPDLTLSYVDLDGDSDPDILYGSHDHLIARRADGRLLFDLPLGKEYTWISIAKRLHDATDMVTLRYHVLATKRGGFFETRPQQDDLIVTIKKRAGRFELASQVITRDDLTTMIRRTGGQRLDVGAKELGLWLTIRQFLDFGNNNPRLELCLFDKTNSELDVKVFPVDAGIPRKAAISVVRTRIVGGKEDAIIFAWGEHIYTLDVAAR